MEVNLEERIILFCVCVFSVCVSMSVCLSVCVSGCACICMCVFCTARDEKKRGGGGGVGGGGGGGPWSEFLHWSSQIDSPEHDFQRVQRAWRRERGREKEWGTMSLPNYRWRVGSAVTCRRRTPCPPRGPGLGQGAKQCPDLARPRPPPPPSTPTGLQSRASSLFVCLVRLRLLLLLCTTAAETRTLFVWIATAAARSSTFFSDYAVWNI